MGIDGARQDLIPKTRSGKPGTGTARTGGARRAGPVRTDRNGGPTERREIKARQPERRPPSGVRIYQCWGCNVGDLANMTDCDGRVNGTRLLRWLRSRAEMEHSEAKRWAELRAAHRFACHAGRADLLDDMADDLERELTPPDYSGEDDDTVDLDEPEYRPCDDCGRMAPLKTVEENGRAADICYRCYRQWGQDTVDMDDPALKGGPEEGTYVVRDASGEYVGGHGRRTPASDEATEFGTWGEAQDACERATDRVLRRD